MAKYTTILLIDGLYGWNGAYTSDGNGTLYWRGEKHIRCIENLSVEHNGSSSDFHSAYLKALGDLESKYIAIYKKDPELCNKLKNTDLRWLNFTVVKQWDVPPC